MMRKLWRGTIACGLVTLALFATGIAQGDEAGATRCHRGARITHIEVQRVNVFDLAQTTRRSWAYRLLNAVHHPMLTRERTVRSLLIVKEGERCNEELIEEAERELRKLPFLQDAWVEVLPGNETGDEVIVRVRVQDGWSTRFGASYGNEGGASRFKVRVAEINLFGTGTRLEWLHRTNQDRSERTLRLTDPSLFGSHWQGAMSYSNNSDGRETGLRVTRPQWSLAERWSTELSFLEALGEEKVYRGAEVAERWIRDSTAAELSYLRSPKGYRNTRLFTWRAGLVMDRQNWILKDPGTQVVHPELRPFDRDLMLASAELRWRRVDIRRAHYLDTGLRVEDLDLGRTLAIGLAISLPGISPEKGARFHLDWRRGFSVGEGAFYRLFARHEMETLRGTFVNVVTSLGAEYYRKITPSQTFVVKLSAARGDQLEGTRRFLLGGDTGLRGYRSRSFSGSRQLLLNIEQRYFTRWKLGRFLGVAFALFGDMGGAWDEGVPLSADLIHADLGVGLRLLLLPSGSGTTFHLNLAYALDPGADPEGRHWRFSLLTKRGF